MCATVYFEDKVLILSVHMSPIKDSGMKKLKAGMTQVLKVYNVVNFLKVGSKGQIIDYFHTLSLK